MNSKTLTPRTKYALAFLSLFLIEALIAIFIHDNFIRPYIGDVLVMVLLYFFVQAILPDKIKYLPIYLFLFGTLVEFLQYCHIVEHLHLESNSVAKVVIGSVFDSKDIVCYGIGCLLVLLAKNIAAKYKALAHNKNNDKSKSSV